MGMKEDNLNDVVQAVQGFYSRKDRAHDLGHALRVRTWGEKLACEEGANSLIVELAALLHDIGRSGAVEKTHAESSAGLAVNILHKCHYQEDVIIQVKDSIVSHSREAGYEPQSIEAKILYDADKLDFVGTVGLARLFLLAGAEGWPLIGKGSCEEFYQNRICGYREHLYTESAKRHFDPLLAYMNDYWLKLHEQMA